MAVYELWSLKESSVNDAGKYNNYVIMDNSHTKSTYFNESIQACVHDLMSGGRLYCAPKKHHLEELKELLLSFDTIEELKEAYPEEFI